MQTVPSLNITYTEEKVCLTVACAGLSSLQGRVARLCLRSFGALVLHS